MKYYNFILAVGGNMANTLSKKGLPACEVHMLAALHGADSITDLVEASKLDKVKVDKDNFEDYLKTRYRKITEKGLLVDVLFLKGTQYDFAANYKDGATANDVASAAKVEVNAAVKAAQEAQAAAEKATQDAEAATAAAQEEIELLKKTAKAKEKAQAAAAKAS